MASSPDIYNRICRSIAPSIYGLEDQKRAVACLLFGGARKKLPDGMTLRGDINVLFLGDPATAKSQLLKFAERVAPICIYTSGKGSSAAGLTGVLDAAGARYNSYCGVFRSFCCPRYWFWRVATGGRGHGACRRRRCVY